ncbi:aminobutyraldehyde dehydrogenase [Saccharopolyspora elongata]|uniref:Aldehyde dehydrogenase family protein n=1 Tax=Saccharopolyspora elongata TaxID=2530387 RepID=A0A4R4XZK6_9PSEU|nr:aminobutyraldehyde dehydrogenase [Saccharopolyspora elongata]TDD36780.1 aldehyde dehydrogenase family protein [Saccharopolyspora elongata]
MTETRPQIEAAPLTGDDPAPVGVEPEALPHFVDGARWAGTGTETHPVVNPATGRPIARVMCGTAADVDQAVAAARRAFAGWRQKTPKDRADVLLEAAAVVETHAEELARLESANAGKPMPLAREDVAGTIDTLRFMAGAVRAQQSASAGEYVAGHTSMIVREPVGVVAAITPWNYPLLTTAWKIGPILAAGNACVLKPSEQTPLTALRLAELLADVLPAGVLNVVTGDGPVVGEALATHPDVALVSVTGSVRSGQAVARAAAESLKRVHLELGGKAPVLVFADADLDAVADGVAFAGFGNSGQDCGAACRVLVEESVYDDLVARLVFRAEALAVGDPAEGDHIEMGPLVTQAHRDRVVGFLDRAYAEGVRAATGGKAPDGDGFFIPPTVLVNIPDGAECTREEIFGPVVTVETFTREDAAVTAANGTRYGLSASVWTENARRAADLPGRLDFGTVWVNDHLAFATEMPWGGFKSSGYGRDLSAYALDDYSRTKHVMVNRTR